MNTTTWLPWLVTQHLTDNFAPQGKPRLHDLAVGREDEDESVEGLEEVRAELLEDLGAPR